jgi:hypothetical protein
MFLHARMKTLILSKKVILVILHFKRFTEHILGRHDMFLLARAKTLNFVKMVF